MYTIKQAAARSGLSVPTVRVWERRYGVVHPERTPAGYRLYDDENVAKLIAMRYLVEGEGIRPSQAADQVLAAGADIDALVRQAQASSTRPAAPPATVATTQRADSQVQAFVDAAGRLDVPTMERLLDEAFASERFEAAMERVVFPALRAVGDGWAEGTVDVAAEHAASETVRRRLVRFFDATASTNAPDVIIGLPPDAHHEIGALAFAVAARRRGLDVLYLGADVPISSWLTAMETSRAPVAVVGVVVAADVESAGAVVVALDGGTRPTTVAVGGTRADQVIVAAGIQLPPSIDEAVTALQELVSIRRARTRIRRRPRETRLPPTVL